LIAEDHGYIIQKIPDTKFNMENEKVASNVYYKLKEKGTILKHFKAIRRLCQ